MKRLSFLWLGLLLGGLAVSVRVAAQPQATVEDARNRIKGLRAERLRLQGELRTILPDDAKLIDAPSGAVLIGVPTSLVEGIVSEALTGPLQNVRLLLKDVVKVELTDVIKTRTFLGLMTLGRYDLAVEVLEVRAILKPKAPKLSFGANRIAIDLPVSVGAANVKANLIFNWDGRKLAGLVCGDLSGEHDLRAQISPLDVRLRGRFEIEAKGEKLRVVPIIAPIDIAFQVEPPQKTWDFIEDLIQSRNRVCESALRKARVGQKVKDLVARGFKVRLPNSWLHPMNLPASFRDTFSVQGRSAGLAIVPTGVSITGTRVWYGASLSVKRQRPAGR